MVKPMPNEKLVLCNVKLTEDEKKQLKKDAYAHLMNVSEYLRWLIERERASAKEVSKEEREREICRSNYASQLEGLGYNADGTPKCSE
jgi:hypothetical protein